MTTFRSVLFAAAALAVSLAPSATAQTYTISTYQGNGQIICSGCAGVGVPNGDPNSSRLVRNFQPMVAKVVDANGQPAPAGTPVYWEVWHGNGNLMYFQTLTDANGLTSNMYTVNPVIGSVAQHSIQSQIHASVGSSPATFYETAAVGDSGFASLERTIDAQGPISGQAGTSATSINVRVWDRATGIDPLNPTGTISGVEVRLVSSQDSPSVACVSGTGADPGTVLTDSTGLATCTPVLSGSGTGQYLILVGGVADNPNFLPICGESYADGGGAAGFFSSSTCLALSVTPPVPGSIVAAGGGSQTANPGQTLPIALTANVKDTNLNVLGNQTVNWTVSPANAGTFPAPSTISNGSGQVQNTFSLSSTANGSFIISATVAGTSLHATFTETAVPLVPPVTLQSLQKVSGDSPVQSVTSGQTFPNPLVVQVYFNNGQAASGVAVNFIVSSGPASVVGSSTVTTDGSGRASVNVVSLSTASQAQVTVTATVGGLVPVTFQLTVIPAGPANIAFFNAADQKPGSISPCSLATVTGNGLVAPSVQGTIVGTPFGPAPTVLAGDSISFPTASGTAQAPIFSVTNINGAQSVTFQVPCEVSVPAAAANGPVPSATVGATIFVGGGSAAVSVPVLAVSPGVYGALGTDGVNRALLARPDGSFVSLANPARRGETVTAFVTGLGPTTPAVGTNQIPPRGTVATVNGIVVPGIAGGGAQLYSLPQLAPDLVGIYEVSFVIPANVGAGNNVGFSIGVIPVGAGVAAYSSLMYIPIGQ